MSQDDQKISGNALILAIYRHAFPDETDRSLLVGSRQNVIADRLGLLESTSLQQVKEIRGSLRTLGYTRSMLDQIRDKPLSEVGLLLTHASDVLSGDIDHGIARPVRPEATTGRNRRSGQVEGPGSTSVFGMGFNRALALTEQDLTAIDAAVIAVTGREPPRGRPR